MASLTSLGVHTPSALPYLVAESILPEDASDEHYQWEIYNDNSLDDDGNRNDYGPDGQEEEEVLATEQCVVYSRGGIVQKVFRFEVEKSRVQQALLTWFPADEKRVPSAKDQTTLAHQQGTNNRRQKQPQSAGAQDDTSTESATAQLQKQCLSRALVVLLQAQAHIYFLNGGSHVVSLPFEVERAFPAPKGLVLQRKIPLAEPAPPTPVVPPPPPNSFFSAQSFSQQQSQLSQRSHRAGSSFGSFRRSKPAHGFSGAASTLTLLETLLKESTTPPPDRLPRLFSLTDPLAELGLVVAPSNNTNLNSSISSTTSISSKKLESLERAEELLYMTSRNEIPDIFDHDKDSPPLLVAVTANYETRMWSVWSASYTEQVPLSSLTHDREALTSTAPGRRSSFGPVRTGATTPAVRDFDGANIRESFGGAAGPTTRQHPHRRHQSQRESLSQTAEDAFASQIEPEFDLSARQPGVRESRRVSSLLSRADIAAGGGGYERSAFQELASQHQGGGGGGRRGVSFGGPTGHGAGGDRTSFGFSQSIQSQHSQRLRASPPASISRLSISEFDPGNDGNTLEDLATDMDMLTEPGDPLLEDISGVASAGGLFPTVSLRKELVLSRLTAIPMDDPNAMPPFADLAGLRKHYSARVFVVPAQRALANPDPVVGRRWFVHIMQWSTRQHVEIEFGVQRSSIGSRRSSGNQTQSTRLVLMPRGFQRHHGRVDAIKLADGCDMTRVLVLHRSAGSDATYFGLHASWASKLEPLAFTIPVPRLKLFNPFSLAEFGDTQLSPKRSSAAGRSRVISSSSSASSNNAVTAFAFGGASVAGVFDVRLTGDEVPGRRHRLKLSLQPKSGLVSQALGTCRAVLGPGAEAEALTGFWWAGMREVENSKKDGGKGHNDWVLYDAEWFALLAAVASMGVLYLGPEAFGDDSPQQQQQRQHSRTLRSSPAKPTSRQRQPSHQQRSAWDRMWDRECGGSMSPRPWTSPAWAWALDPTRRPKQAQKAAVQSPQTMSGKYGRASSSAVARTGTPSIIAEDPIKNACRDIMLDAVACAKMVVGRKWGQAIAKGLQGRDLRTGLVKMLFALHLLREEGYLTVLAPKPSCPSVVVGDLTPLLAQIGSWLGWGGQRGSWGWERGGYYDISGGTSSKWRFHEAKPVQNGAKRSPPREWKEPPCFFAWLENAVKGVDGPEFSSLLQLVGIGAEEEYGEPTTGTGTSAYAKQLLAEFTPRTCAVTAFFSERNRRRRNDRRSYSAATDVEIMASCGINSVMLDSFVEAVAAPFRDAIVRCQESPPTTWDRSLLRLVGREDLELLMSTKVDWVRDTQVSVAGATNAASRDVRSICRSAEQVEATPMSPEADRFMITRLIFSEDRRFVEAAKLLNPMRQAVAECVPDPSWSEADHFDAQKAVMQWVMVRTFSLPLGHAMLLFDSKKPLLTERYHIHGFNTSCLMKPMENVVMAERLNYTEEKQGWAYFHIGVSAGLAISRNAEGIDTGWIMFNKPEDLSHRHAGLLFGLGLNGHLKTIAKRLSFKYLTPKHTMTSIGLLLGLSVSFLGTMDTLVTRLLSVHIVRMLPPGAAELNLSPHIQTTGLLGIGLLYYNTQHRRMSEVMLSEIEHVTLSDAPESADTLRDEGYRLAAGFALGFINLGKGKDLRGLHDMRLIERLLAVAVGTKPVDAVHILDQATAGATIAIALIFLKTGDQAVARKVDVPDTVPQFDYVRSDIFLLRTLAKHLILWDGIHATPGWIAQNLPKAYADNYDLSGIRVLRSEHLPFFNILTGLLWAISLRYAGSGDAVVRDFLLGYLDHFIRLCHLPAIKYDARLTRNTVRNSQDLVALAAATVMSGTGDLAVLRRLRLLHGRVGPDVPFGSHMASHLAIGALFLAGGTHAFGNSNLAVASLVLAFYPLFPLTVHDNKAHLQAFRHFWVLAAEPRCLVVREVETRRAISVGVVVRLKKETLTQEIQKQPAKPRTLHLTAPCLLPPLSAIASIQTTSSDHWPVKLDLARNPAHAAAFARTQTLPVRRRPAHTLASAPSSQSLVAIKSSKRAKS
ncbi:hypothetical protein BDY21DRAFT_272583, partial [Lineolata rhizophorae]